MRNKERKNKAKVKLRANETNIKWQIFQEKLEVEIMYIS